MVKQAERWTTPTSVGSIMCFLNLYCTIPVPTQQVTALVPVPFPVLASLLCIKLLQNEVGILGR